MRIKRIRNTRATKSDLWTGRKKGESNSIIEVPTKKKKLDVINGRKEVGRQPEAGSIVCVVTVTRGGLRKGDMKSHRGNIKKLTTTTTPKNGSGVNTFAPLLLQLFFGPSVPASNSNPNNGPLNFSSRELRPKSLRRWVSPRLAGPTSLGGELTAQCRTGRRCCCHPTDPTCWRRDGPAAISNARPPGRYRPLSVQNRLKILPQLSPVFCLDINIILPGRS